MHPVRFGAWLKRAFPTIPKFILLNDFTCRETRLHNADWFNRMITLGSIQRYAVYIPLLTTAMCCIILYLLKQYS